MKFPLNLSGSKFFWSIPSFIIMTTGLHDYQNYVFTSLLVNLFMGTYIYLLFILFVSKNFLSSIHLSTGIYLDLIDN